MAHWSWKLPFLEIILESSGINKIDYVNATYYYDNPPRDQDSPISEAIIQVLPGAIPTHPQTHPNYDSKSMLYVYDKIQPPEMIFPHIAYDFGSYTPPAFTNRSQLIKSNPVKLESVKSEPVKSELDEQDVWSKFQAMFIGCCSSRSD